MSGYLQRLVSTAAGRGESLHPRTGSIYSGPWEETDYPSVSEETETTAVSQPRAESHEPLQEIEPSEQKRSIAARALYVPLFAKPIAIARPPEEAPLPAPATPRLHARSEALRIEGAPESPRRGVTPAAEVEPEAPEARAVDGAFLSSLRPGRVHESRANVAASSAARQGRHAGPVERQPDEIQIHIGRIEVTAMLPPVPRGPKASDRGLSLDAYLNRRNGRAK